MTWLDDIGIRIPRRKKLILTDPMQDTSKLSVVIPVKNNQAGIDKLLTSVFNNVAAQDKPSIIIIVDNNSDIPLTISALQHDIAKANNISIIVLKCKRPGPAAARNTGWQYAVSNDAEWILFVDSDCVFTPTTIPSYVSVMDGSIAYQGAISALSDDWLSSWYIKEGILNPRAFRDPHDLKQRPNYIITANVLINKMGLLKTGGFNEGFKLAAGEDVWLGYMLSDIGTLAYAPNAVIKHDFLDGTDEVKVKCVYDLIRRFERYGHGNHTLDILKGIAEKADYWQDAMPSDEYLAYRKFISESDHDATSFPITDMDLHSLTNAALKHGYNMAKEQHAKIKKSCDSYSKICTPRILTGFLLSVTGAATIAYVATNNNVGPKL